MISLNKVAGLQSLGSDFTEIDDMLKTPFVFKY